MTKKKIIFLCTFLVYTLLLVWAVTYFVQSKNQKVPETMSEGKELLEKGDIEDEEFGVELEEANYLVLKGTGVISQYECESEQVEVDIDSTKKTFCLSYKGKKKIQLKVKGQGKLEKNISDGNLTIY